MLCSPSFPFANGDPLELEAAIVAYETIGAYLVNIDRHVPPPSALFMSYRLLRSVETGTCHVIVAGDQKANVAA